MGQSRMNDGLTDARRELQLLSEAFDCACTGDKAYVRPNAELTGRRRVDALPARCSIDSGRLAGKAASRWRSG